MNNTLELRVGMMPGKLVNVVVEKGITARECFKIAEIELSNHEIRLDGEKIDLDRNINEGRLLVGMKMVKGNMKTIKVGLMPGKLQQIEVSENTTAREVFEKAGIELANHEIRLDGEKIDLDTNVYNGSLCVGLKMIKGNSDVYVTDCTDEEVEMLLGVALPREINKNNVSTCGENFLEVNVDSELLVVDEDMFNSVYSLKTKEEVVEEVTCTKEVNTQNDKAMKVLDEELKSLEGAYSYYIEEAHKVQDKILFLTRLISEINA